MMANQAMDISADGSDPAPGRESGIVEVERKASVVIGSPMNGSPDRPAMNGTAMNSPLLGVESAAQRGHEIEIDLAVDALAVDAREPRASLANAATLANGTPGDGATLAGNSPGALDEETIQVLDDEIESADVPPRPNLPSSILSRVSLTPGGEAHSRPPPPSLRPRGSSPSLPPPRRSSRVGAPLGSSLPPPSDQWILANKTLEIGRAHARIIALEEQVAFRDARIQTLEERLANARQKLEELESKLGSAPSTRSALGSTRSNGTLSKNQPGPAGNGLGSDGPGSNGLSGNGAGSPGLGGSPAGKPASTIVAAAPKKVRAPQERREDDAFTPEPPGVAATEAEFDGASDEDDADLDADGLHPASGGPEDLRQINGIGPRFEAALRKQGITRLSQIAAWSDADVRQVAKALKIPKSRIVKGRWVEAAREMIGSRATSE